MTHDANVTVLMPAELRAFLERRAEAEDLTISQIMRRMVRAAKGAEADAHPAPRKRAGAAA